jgi:hypothetical protein
MKGSQRARDRRSSGKARQRQQWLIVGIVAIIVIAVIAGLIIASNNATPHVAALASSPSSADLTEESYPEQSRDHIQRGTAHGPYNSNPPTSGPHYADRPNMQQTAPGFYDEKDAPLDEDLIHTEEHGYVIIWYDCAKAPNGNCDALKEGIKELMAQLGGQKLIATPRADMPTMLALTSWTKVQRLDAFDVDKITTFYKTHLGQAPEPGAY